MKPLKTLIALLLTCVVAAPWPARSADDNSIVVASTTSTQDSGLFEYLLPLVHSRTGLSVHVIAQGTGQALDTARRGDADVVFVHDKEAEEAFVAEGHGVQRLPVMYNDFVLVGPAADPAHVRGSRDVTQALQAISASHSTFISRGDRSGTHQAELRLWAAAGIAIDIGKDTWYRSVGQGMGAALNMASASNAYVLADRATWVRFGNKADLQILSEGDPRLFNQYGVIMVNPERHPAVKQQLARQFVDYLTSPEGQNDIGRYRIDGQQVFYPNARAAAR